MTRSTAIGDTLEAEVALVTIFLLLATMISKFVALLTAVPSQIGNLIATGKVIQSVVMGIASGITGGLIGGK